MGFNAYGNFWIAPLSSLVVAVWWGTGSDQGAEYIAAHPITQGDLTMSGETKSQNDLGGFFYSATVTNEDNFWVNFNLQGGGFS